MSPSAFAGNELLIDLVQLRDAGWLTATDIEPDPLFREDRVNYPATKRYRMARLRLAAERFFAEGQPTARKGFNDFCGTAADWLDPASIAARVGKTVQALQRHLYRCGRADLARLLNGGEING